MSMTQQEREEKIDDLEQRIAQYGEYIYGLTKRRNETLTELARIKNEGRHKERCTAQSVTL